MKRPLLLLALGSLLALSTACPHKDTGDDDKSGQQDKKKKKKDKKDKPKADAKPVEDDDGDNDQDKPEKFTAPAPVSIDEARTMNALEAEVADLKEELKDGKSPRIAPVINAHEHLYHVKDLEKYLPGARKAGVAMTVFVASSAFTLEGKGEKDAKGEPSMSKNFEDVLLEAAKQYPGEVIPFCTLDPKDPDKLERLKKHVGMGCKGLKLYSGHTNFYDGPLDAADMDPVYSYLEETQLPVLWHVHLGKYMDDFERVVTKHGKMNLMVPHYGVSFWKPTDGTLDRLKVILKAHPNIYIDTSLGTRQILTDGMAAMEPALDSFRAFFVEFQNQIMWGTDSVVTANAEKTPEWFTKVIWATRDHLEKDVFTTDLAAAYSKYYQKGRDGDGRYQGLHLPPEILKKVYVDNAKKWLRIK